MTATASTTAEALNFYRTPAKMTDPADARSALDGLPAEIGEAPQRRARAAPPRTTFAPAYGVQLSDARRKENPYALRGSDDRALSEPRPSPADGIRALDIAPSALPELHGLRSGALRAREYLPVRAAGSQPISNPQVRRPLGRGALGTPQAPAGSWSTARSMTSNGRSSILISMCWTCRATASWWLAMPWRACRERRLDPESFGILDMHGNLVRRRQRDSDAAALNEMSSCRGRVGRDATTRKTLDDDRLASSTTWPS